MKKDTIIAVLATFCLTATLFMISSSLGYDPWADINEDGRIDMRDIAYEASLFGSSGDPTKNVTVMNWPTHKNTAVWYAESLTSGEVELSPFYNASGFRDFLNTSGVLCNQTDVNVSNFYCHLNTTENQIYARLPHFSTVSPTVTGASVASSNPGGSSGGDSATSALTISTSKSTEITLSVGKSQKFNSIESS